MPSPQEPAAQVAGDSQDSQTAQEFIKSQLQLEADAREVLPYRFDTCTYPLGPLRQTLFSCLTCNPPPSSPSETYTPAGVCYSCSISCHGEHELVELFSRRDFACDCGTKRLPSTSTCSLRMNNETGRKGGLHSDEPVRTNKYNHNFGNRFCGCGELYDPLTQKGTMFQCLGLGTIEEGGCGEDWWHPECLLGPKERQPHRRTINDHSSGADVRSVERLNSTPQPDVDDDGGIMNVAETTQDNGHAEVDETDLPLPPGFPPEDDFEHLLCYKCTNAFPWIKRYAGAAGFLAGVRHNLSPSTPGEIPQTANGNTDHHTTEENSEASANGSRKRKSCDEAESTVSGGNDSGAAVKKPKLSNTSVSPLPSDGCKADKLPNATTEPISLFLHEDFRDHICHCAACFPQLKPHPQILSEEDTYSPPLSEAGSNDANGEGTGSVGSRSLLDRGEAALSNMDRVKAIEGAMAYNHLRDKVKGFLKPFAESGQAVGAEDIKQYFEKLRGDEAAMKEAALKNNAGDDDGPGDNHREQSGY
ncbi:MAG: hypothetical protein M1828_003457 [Chrysothrix sp. TS-e1954]|nr:MAG: hypothetical protein M1828_003457 [Chrysothrix sp. TS-e1954]